VKDSSPGEDGIPYSFYKSYIDILGTHMIKAWEYSLELGILPASQRSACITLLPKNGKDRRKIENWRPISLSNCDIKIFTKTLALRLNEALPDIIHESQAAYVPGRNITENLRTMRITRDITKDGKKDSLLISLDVKKAYDSLDHEYLLWSLHKYGFGDKLNTIKMLYNSNKSKVMINGHKTEEFNVERGVKQGDALSCGLFIIAMDPLIRSINENKKIIAPTLFVKRKIKAPKCLAYADDLTILCKNSVECVREVFKTYSKFTYISGLELNAEKTEIFNSGENNDQVYSIMYMDKNINLKTHDSIKIGGIVFHTDNAIEHQLNVGEKINNMENQFKHWMARDLTINGRSIIAKAYGISQIIYVMQTCEFHRKDLIEIERLYFKFLWAKSWNTKNPERIKRTCLKMERNQGGINALDIESLYTAIKIKQITNALSSNRFIKEIQDYLLAEGNKGFSGTLNYEFNHIQTKDHATAESQKAMNKIIRYYCDCKFSIESEEPKTDLIKMAQTLDLEAHARVNNLKIAEQQIRKINYNRQSNINIVDLQTIIEDDRPYSIENHSNICKIWNYMHEGIKLSTEFNIEKD
jgi:hypothetical protein